ncbi:MAG: site-specific DNA-methyltransferase [Flavobacteriales bacterium]|nr:MAG: site-specific DNA-methyltransferase [Flavobacteriales bacterium]MBE7442220.1 site-specific DNA-methyltransferase [Flavobacteriales bacterium]
MAEQDFIKAGFTVVGNETNENKLLSFLKENYPNVIRDTEINIEELKAVLGLPIDEKVNGYGLNFVGRNFARAKYAQKTEKELRLNSMLSKNIDTTENLVLKGDNLDSLKILKNHYSGQIKCIYIDPPYNTEKDEFVYPDRFDKEEAEVLGLANLSESDFARMDFSFKTKKSHNGWLAFMYPRLLMARDLLRKDGVIFISIDDNEQANLKLLCDDVFGDENFEGHIHWRRRHNQPNDKTKMIGLVAEHILSYSKNKEEYKKQGVGKVDLTGEFSNPDNDERGDWASKPWKVGSDQSGSRYIIKNPVNGKEYDEEWMGDETNYKLLLADNRIVFPKNGEGLPRKKYFRFEREEEGQSATNWWSHQDFGHNQGANDEMTGLFGVKNVFSNPKPKELIRGLVQISNAKNNDLILDFFAGSGTTGHTVMQLNAEDGGNRKFILCQIDENIDPVKKKDAYDFCIQNNLEPVISSITIERLKRAGEKISDEIRIENEKGDLFKKDKKQVPDIGFKVFDSVEAPKLQVDEKGQISFTVNESDTLSRIYNMIFTVGLDEPTKVPEEVVKDCIYKIGNHYYITNSELISSDDFSNAIKNGKVFIDGWTASLNGTLQNYKEDVKIVF